jgi:MFS family permease
MRRWWPAGLAWGLWALTLLGLGATLWLDALLRRAGYAELALVLGGGSVPSLVAAVSAATVGALVAGRRPGHRVGWLLAALGLSIAVAGFCFSYTRYGLVARPGALPGARWLAGVANGGVFTYLSCTGFILLLSPTGTLPSPRWRWWARLTAAGVVVAFLASVLHPRPLYPEYPEIGNPIGVDALEHGLGAAIFPVGALLVLAGLVVGAVSLLLRFRRARGLERLQLRWLALGAALAALAFAVSMTALVVEQSDGWVFQAALGVSVALLPLATGAAILRYRLYDIDRIVSRTLTYALLTVLLGLGYAAVVLGLGRLLGRESSLVVAAATLAVAAAFQPARRRVQALVDRRFNRRRYDAARTVEAFAARLRDQVDLQALRGELLAVVDQTMQPAHASLWLRPRPLPPEGHPLP